MAIAAGNKKTHELKPHATKPEAVVANPAPLKEPAPWEPVYHQRGEAAIAELTEDVSTSITQTWTDQAIKCYLTKANCADCSIPRGNYSFACQMFKVVPVLLKNLGRPDQTRVHKLTPYLHYY